MKKGGRPDLLGARVKRAVSMLGLGAPSPRLVDGLRDAPPGDRAPHEIARLEDELNRLKATLEEALLWLRAQDPDHAARILARALDDAGDTESPRR